ncbi:translation initiation factor IF-2 [Nitrososphaera viennensis]|uniref:Probable translation initiation factor IF-2 n=2 Tax=Nitrososphaera viennensis TaxID=1034015 RepID=A0A060HQ01_9ARCH|nr:translation initiation factor IF-2 [Nitrososphaera viennensis]AIC17205.1 translation initiation factor IF-2 [Nitrososphaera viennensis EN76]UVS69092.1 translation initiation factor IF-2 [Nitrososphaera viennensis]
MELRQPVVVVLGHADSGKTSLLDKIRGTAVQAREVGGITQHIGASFFPIDTIKEVTGPLYDRLAKSETPIPGLLVIDTPGHEVFANLRMRGGSAADIAIVVADVNKGFEAQTIESIEILKKRRVPFVVALNKVDRVTGWRPFSRFISEEAKKQSADVQTMLDEKIYTVVGSLSRLGFPSEAFWRVKDFTKEIAIVPVSARTGVGIPELLAVLVGLTQQFMGKRLERHEGAARGLVLEINEEPGLGPSANIILLDGTLKQGDSIIVAKRDSAVQTRVKALLLPKPLDEMRDPRDKFKPVSEVTAAAGLKVTSPDLEGVLAGSPLYVFDKAKGEDELERLRSIVEGEIKNAIVSTETSGVILKCDTIGSLEAIIDLLKKESIPIRTADIGSITRRDIIEASAVRESDRYHGVVLGFNVKVLDDAEREAQDRSVKIFNERIIYNLVRSYVDWVTYQKEHEESILFNEIPPICRFQFMKGFVFRRNDPAVFGAEIQVGKLRQKVQVINVEGRKVGTVHQIQDSGKSMEEATTGMQVAVSLKEPTIGRQINEGDVFYTDINSHNAKQLAERFNHRLNDQEKEVFNLIVALKRKEDPAFGYL